MLPVRRVDNHCTCVDDVDLFHQSAFDSFAIHLVGRTEWLVKALFTSEEGDITIGAKFEIVASAEIPFSFVLDKCFSRRFGVFVVTAEERAGAHKYFAGFVVFDFVAIIVNDDPLRADIELA